MITHDDSATMTAVLATCMGCCAGDEDPQDMDDGPLCVNTALCRYTHAHDHFGDEEVLGQSECVTSACALPGLSACCRCWMRSHILLTTRARHCSDSRDCASDERARLSLDSLCSNH